MRAANYYFQHLDRKVRVVVVSDATANQQTTSGGSPSKLSQPAAPQPQATLTSTAAENPDDELDKLLLGEGPEDFDLDALKALQSCTPQKATHTPQVLTCSLLLSLLDIPVHSTSLRHAPLHRTRTTCKDCLQSRPPRASCAKAKAIVLSVGQTHKYRSNVCLCAWLQAKQQSTR